MRGEPPRATFFDVRNPNRPDTTSGLRSHRGIARLGKHHYPELVGRKSANSTAGACWDSLSLQHSSPQYKSKLSSAPACPMSEMNSESKVTHAPIGRAYAINQTLTESNDPSSSPNRVRIGFSSSARLHRSRSVSVLASKRQIVSPCFEPSGLRKDLGVPFSWLLVGS